MTLPAPIEQIARDAELPQKLRLMAEGAKELDAPYDAAELMRVAANEIERLQACGQQPAVAGYKLVPIEPTTDMAWAGFTPFSNCLKSDKVMLMPHRDRNVLALKMAYKAMLVAAPTPPVQQPAPTEAEPDWWWCDIDPDESGDSAYEAMHNHRPRFEPVQLHSSYHGPTKYGVMVPSLEDDGEEAFTFGTEEEAKKFIEQRKAAPHPVRGGEL